MPGGGRAGDAVIDRSRRKSLLPPHSGLEASFDGVEMPAGYLDRPSCCRLAKSSMP